MSDISSSRSVDQTFNSLLSECTWGSFDSTRDIDQRSHLDWKIVSTAPTSDPPCDGLVTFGAYLEDYTRVSKSEQRMVKRSFTQGGCIGSSMAAHIDVLKHSMLCSEKTVQFAKAHKLSYLEEGYYHILPSFIDLIEHLVSTSVQFKIVFRTFGIDIANVANEFNLYCEARHPEFIPKVKLDGSSSQFPYDLRIHLPKYCGKLLRTSDNWDGVCFAYVDNNQTVQIARGVKEVHQIIYKDWLGVDLATNSISSTNISNNSISNGNKVCSIAIRDDFEWWRDHHESDNSGKLLLIHQSKNNHKNNDDNGSGNNSKNSDTTAVDSLDSTVIQVFFDDNIERDRAHIVDVRDFNTFATIPFTIAKENCYIRRVEPYLAITDRHYYVKEIDTVLSKHYNAN